MAASSSSSLPPERKDVNWAGLPPELTSLILQRLGAIEIVKTAEKVCRSWRSVCKNPLMWRKIEMHSLGGLSNRHCKELCRHLVDRSQGGLVEIHIRRFGTDSLLDYIAHRSRNLRSLTVALCPQITKYALVEAVMKLPLLEELAISDYRSLPVTTVKVVGLSCPNLKTFKTKLFPRPPGFGFKDDLAIAEIMRFGYDDFALAIAETMPRLRYLQLRGDKLTEAGLNAILVNCPNLEHLDISDCPNVYCAGDLENLCSKRIKVVRHASYVNLAEDDYSYGFSDTDFILEDEEGSQDPEMLQFELDYD